jgi:hypothetical protein
MQGERSERVKALQKLSHELTEVALGLPYGWAVLIESNGQVRMVPPAEPGYGPPHRSRLGLSTVR